MRLIHYFFLFLLLVFSKTGLSAQKSTKAPKDSSDLKLFAIPAVFYTPDTKLGFGGGGIATFQSPHALYPNSVTFSLVYTIKKQILAWFPFQYYAPNTAWQTYGEVGYYKYIYEYFGVGNEVPNDYVEKYTAEFPRVRISVLKKIRARQFAGVRYGLDDYRLLRVDSSATGLLYESGRVGAAGGRSSGSGLMWLTDTRDARFYPRKGWWVEYLAYTDSRFSGSDFDYQQLSIDASKYLAFGKKNTLVLNAAAMATFGEAPFFQLPTLGGPRRLRGYKFGKYRDRHLALFQAEFRRTIKGRWGAVAFAGAGGVWGEKEEQFKPRPNYGFGVRFKLDTKQNLNVRADYGFGTKGNGGFYLTIGEAF